MEWSTLCRRERTMRDRNLVACQTLFSSSHHLYSGNFCPDTPAQLGGSRGISFHRCAAIDHVRHRSPETEYVDGRDSQKIVIFEHLRFPW